MNGSDLKAQMAAARSAALAIDATEMAALVVTGKDRVSWLNGLVTCDVGTRGPGDAVYGLAVAQKGRILTDLVVVLAERAALVVLPRTKLEEIHRAFDHYLIMEDAELTPEPDAYAVRMLYGPRARDVLTAARRAGALGGEVDLTGLGGAIVLAAAPHEAAVRAAIEASLAEVGGLHGDEAGAEALRLERAVPRFGVDFDGATYPQEAGLEKTAVSFSKGCYLGQEVVCMLELRGHVKRKLVPLVLAGDTVPPPGTVVADEVGAAVGQITSAGVSPTRHAPIAMAMVKRAHAAVGTMLRVGEAQAEVVGRPA